MVNTKAKGTRAEHRSRAFLEAQGYACTRSAGSLGLFDLVCISVHDVTLVQVKSTRWPGTAEVDRLLAFPVPAGVRKVVHRWRPRCRAPDIRAMPAADTLQTLCKD